MKEFYLNSFDGTPIYVTIWDDVDSPKGIIQFCHGMSEYAGRYGDFAEFLNKNGYIVFADDHRGHGRTEKDEKRGNHKGNVFKDTLKDQLFFREWIKKEYPDYPVFFVGHSYGSFLGQAFAQAGTDVKAIALLGTGYMRGTFTLGKIALAPVCLVARNWRPKIVNYVSDRCFTYKGDSGRLQWSVHDKAMREEFINGKYTHTDMSVGFSFYMMRETSKLYSKKAVAKLNPATVIGIFCGTDDPIGQYSKGAVKLDEFYKKNGFRTELKLYKEARHEVVFDISKDEARQDIVDFFDKFLIYRQQTIDDLLK
ncbi:MAG: alpha/beta hydrolase [Clostridia bacterium]|nr:alpha/beta hydrolase [Clostridia bacterium]